MDHQDIHARLKAADEVVAIGSKPAHERGVLGLVNLGNLARGAVLAGALAMGVSGALHTAKDYGVFAGEQHTTTSQVVAKVWQPGGALLSKDYYMLGQNKVWQPIEDAIGSSRQLVLQVDGQVVAVAVSPEIYDQYCKSADMSMVRGGHDNPAHLGNCGATFQAGKPAPAHIALDEIQVSYTRDGEGAIHITQVSGMQQMATSFLDRYQMRKESKKVLDVASAEYRSGRSVLKPA